MKLRDTFPADIETIVFDMGNVLIDLDIPATLRAFADLQIGGLREEDIHPHQRGFWLAYELGQIYDRGFLEAIRAEYDAAGATDSEIWAAWNAMLPAIDPQRYALIEELSTRYRLFVLSNTNPQHVEHIKKLVAETIGGKGFEAYFERCFYSHELLLRKPDPAIYRHVERETGIDPETTLFIDDNACNLLPATALHWKTHHLTARETIADLFE
jgi:putative hydrolase of the HAD superfamily